MKKILLLSPLPPPQGGIATWTATLVKNGLPNFDIKLVDTKIIYNRNIFSRKLHYFQELKRTFSIFFRCFVSLLCSNIDVVHINSSLSSSGVFRDMLCLIISKAFRTPVIIHYRGNLSDFNLNKPYSLGKKCIRALMRLADLNLVVNQESKDLVEPNKVKLLPNFIEDTAYSYEAEFFDVQHKEKTAMFVGGITAQKGIFEIIEVAKRLPHIKFKLIGALHEDVKLSMERLSNNIIMTGALPHEQVLKELCAADMFLFPSHTEGFPNSVLESMSIGLPVIATAVGAIPDMIQQGVGGFVVKVGEVDDLERMVDTIASDDELQMKMGKFNREFSKRNYSYSNVSKSLTRVYQQVIDKS